MNAARPSLAAKSREQTGKHVARLRREGLVPGVVFGHGVPSSNVTVDAHEFELFRKHTGANTLIDLVVDDGKPTPIIVHGVQIHPVTRRPLHVDLFAVRMTEELTVEVPIITTGVLQGFGLGFVFTPLSIVTFSTLPRHIMTQGTAIFSLMRNIGGSIGISIVVALLSENTQTVHSRLIESLRPDNPLAQAPFLAPPYSLSAPSGIAALNAEVTRQAQMVAYIDDFQLMMVIILVAAPLLFLLRKPRPQRAPGLAAAE